MNNREMLAANIKARMRRFDIRSKVKLARVTGVSNSQIGNILHCKKAASIDLLERLSNGLNCQSWCLLAPEYFSEKFEDTEFITLAHCYTKLCEHDQNAVWDLIHELSQIDNTNQ